MATVDTDGAVVAEAAGLKSRAGYSERQLDSRFALPASTNLSEETRGGSRNDRERHPSGEMTE